MAVLAGPVWVHLGSVTTVGKKKTKKNLTLSLNGWEKRLARLTGCRSRTSGVRNVPQALDISGACLPYLLQFIH